jgi:hypothetical protein
MVRNCTYFFFRRTAYSTAAAGIGENRRMAPDRRVKRISPALVLGLAAAAAFAFAGSQLGKPFSLDQPTAIHEILATPANYVSKTVQVRGRITAVCQAMGCWMALADTTDPTQTIRIDVEGSDIAFPKDSAGKMAIAEGILTKQELTRDQVIARAKHEAAEQGRKFDPVSIRQGATYYEIRGTGALIAGNK